MRGRIGWIQGAKGDYWRGEERGGGPEPSVNGKSNNLTNKGQSLVTG